MGQHTSVPYALVVMTNKDVYYISLSEADRLDSADSSVNELFHTTDVKSKAKLRLQPANISSVVIEEARNA